jgi:hypothetical protein
MGSQFHSDSPEIFIKILAILKTLPDKSSIDSALEDLMLAAFLGGGFIEHASVQFARACLRSDEPWELLTGYPPKVPPGEGFQFDFSPASPTADEKPERPEEQAETITYKLCDYESFFIHIFNQAGDEVFQVWTSYEAADELEGLTLYIDTFGANKTRMYAMNLNITARRNAKQHKGKLTLADNSVVRFTDKESRPLVLIDWRSAESHPRAFISVRDSSGKIIRTLTVDE